MKSFSGQASAHLQLTPFVLKGELSPKNKCGLYDRASPEKCFGVSLAYVRGLEGSRKAGWSVVWCHAALGGVPDCRRHSDK